MSDWTARAECRGYPTAWFFPPDSGPYLPRRWEPPAEALELCARCPVTVECDAAAGNQFGVWAGRYRPERQSRTKQVRREFENSLPRLRTRTLALEQAVAEYEREFVSSGYGSTAAPESSETISA